MGGEENPLSAAKGIIIAVVASVLIFWGPIYLILK